LCHSLCLFFLRRLVFSEMILGCVLLTPDFHSLLFCCFVSMLKVVVFKLGVDELVAQHFLLHLSLPFLIAHQWRSWAWSCCLYKTGFVFFWGK
jgi:hypothetical protein